MNNKSCDDIPVLVIFAPTATGKTELARTLFASDADSPFAGRVEIISADSMQVYRHMNIGTAKPDSIFLQKLPHHLIDIRNPDQQFGAGEFVPLADECCKNIFQRGKIPVVLGGTAFYIKNFLFGLPPTPTSDENVRKKLQQRLVNEGIEKLLCELAEKDPESAQRINIHDEYRILRALEVYETSGFPLSSFSVSQEFRSGFRFLVLSLHRPRQELYERINFRVLEMFKQGLENEVKKLVESGYTKDSPGMQAIGYREFFMDYNSTDSLINMIQKDSRRYAKRQITFFKVLENINILNPDDKKQIIKKIEDFYNV